MSKTYYPKDILDGDIEFKEDDKVMIPFCENGMTTFLTAEICSGEQFEGEGLYLSFVDDVSVDWERDTELHHRLFSCRNIVPKDGYVLLPQGSTSKIKVSYPAKSSNHLSMLLTHLLSSCCTFDYCCMKNKKHLIFDDRVINEHQHCSTYVFHNYYDNIKEKPYLHHEPNVLSLFGYGKYTTKKWQLYELISLISGKSKITRVYENTDNVDLIRLKYDMVISDLESVKKCAFYSDEKPRCKFQYVEHKELINHIPHIEYIGWYSPFENILNRENMASNNDKESNHHIPLTEEFVTSGLPVKNPANIPEGDLYTSVFPTDVEEINFERKIPDGILNNTKTTLAATAMYQTQTKKEKTMDTKTALIDSNKDAAFIAAQIEAGRLATAMLTKMATPHLPMILQGYAQHPLAALILANMAVFGVEQFRPTDEKAKFIAKAMQISAYTELFKSFNVEEMINTVFDELSDKIKFPTMKKEIEDMKL